MVPLTGTISYNDLAEKSKVGESVLKDMIRLVIPAVGFFTEPLKGHVGHSATSAIFVRNPEVAAVFLFTSMSIPQSAINLYEALLLDPSGQDQDACAFRVTHRNPDGNPEGIWDRLKRMPEESKWFMTTMNLFAKRPTYGAVHLVDGYDWSALQSKTVVDVSRPYPLPAFPYAPVICHVDTAILVWRLSRPCGRSNRQAIPVHDNHLARPSRGHRTSSACPFDTSAKCLSCRPQLFRAPVCFRCGLPVPTHPTLLA